MTEAIVEEEQNQIKPEQLNETKEEPNESSYTVVVVLAILLGVIIFTFLIYYCTFKLQVCTFLCPKKLSKQQISSKLIV